jgi:hypothetical protein
MRMTRSSVTVVAVVAVLLGAATVARAAGFAPHQLSLEAGLGVSDFTRASVRDVSTGAGTWNVRLVVGPRWPVAFEAAYLGSFGGEHDPFASAQFVTSQVTGSARLNILRRRVQPFLVAGTGWVNFHSLRQGDANVAAANFAANTNAAIFPMGGGLAGYLGRHGVLEARATYDLVVGGRDFSATGVRPDRWTATFGGGYAF